MIFKNAGDFLVDPLKGSELRSIYSQVVALQAGKQKVQTFHMFFQRRRQQLSNSAIVVYRVIRDFFAFKALLLAQNIDTLIYLEHVVTDKKDLECTNRVNCRFCKLSLQAKRYQKQLKLLNRKQQSV